MDSEIKQREATRSLIYTAKIESGFRSMERIANNDEGIAYGIIIFVGVLVLGGLTYILLTGAFNGIIDAANIVIGIGALSEQSADAVLWNQTLFLSVPVIVVIGVAIWGVVRALEKGA